MVATILTVNDHEPEVADDAFLAETALVAGNVTLASGVSVWFGCVVRSEYEEVRIGVDSNLQDLTVVHADPGFPTIVGERVTVGHRAVLHGCTIEDDVLIGMGAVVLNGATIGEGAVVAAGAVVTEGTEIPPRTIALGVPAEAKDLDVPEIPRHNVDSYLHLAELYREAEATS
jgi:carbonic anhydrase/acetyltransferase-like protein (isoleucine patch superfamily)